MVHPHNFTVHRQNFYGPSTGFILDSVGWSDEGLRTNKAHRQVLPGWRHLSEGLWTVGGRTKTEWYCTTDKDNCGHEWFFPSVFSAQAIETTRIQHARVTEPFH